MSLLDRVRYFVVKRLPLQAKFRRIYRDGGFGGTRESVSGVGSTVEVTRELRQAIGELVKRLGVRSLLDAPCGDFNWMAQVDLGGAEYHGVDIVPEIVRLNQERFGGAGRAFARGDLRLCELPSVELVLCRDCLVHLSGKDGWMVLRNLLRTGASWYLLTTFPELPASRDLPSGMGWRPLNLERSPFDLPPPEALLHEAEVDDSAGAKALGVWRRQQLERAVEAHRS